MEAPMVGSWRVKVHGIRPFTIHGDLYYELQVSRDEPELADKMFVIRAPQHACGEIGVRDLVTVTFLMGQVTSVKK